MGNLYKKDLINWCYDQIGYMEDPIGSNRTKYGELVDRIGLFCGDKNGIAWCSTFCEAGVFENVFSDSKPDYDDNDRKWDTLYFLCQPSPSKNYACSCRWAAKYFREKGAWHTKDDFEEGDIVFFGSEGEEYHQGVVVARMENRQGFYSVEGNHDNGVFKVWHDIEENISGFGVPRYDDEPDESNDHDDEPVPEPTPEPVPDPEPTTEKYKVKTNGDVLRLRAEPNVSSDILAVIPNGTVINVSEIVEGESINWNTDWAKTTYDGETGYCSCSWLVKI